MRLPRGLLYGPGQSTPINLAFHGFGPARFLLLGAGRCVWKSYGVGRGDFAVYKTIIILSRDGAGRISKFEIVGSGAGQVLTF